MREKAVNDLHYLFCHEFAILLHMKQHKVYAAFRLSYASRPQTHPPNAASEPIHATPFRNSLRSAFIFPASFS